MKDEARQARWFETHYHCTLEPVRNQRVGVGRDYQIVKLYPDSTLPVEALHQYVEFKCDKAAKRYQNLYLEYKQTFDFGETFQASGMLLAVAQSVYIVFSVPYGAETHHYAFTVPEMKEILNRPLGSRRTLDNKNGNPDGSFTYGYLLPLRTIEKFRQIEQT